MMISRYDVRRERDLQQHFGWSFLSLRIVMFLWVPA
jgi:hypothetical protein